MKISVWKKYHVIQIVGPIVTFVISVILGFMQFKIFAILIALGGTFCTAIILHLIKCPKCGKSIDNYTTLLSGPEDGWFSPMSKKCKNCGFDLTSKFNTEEKKS